MSLRPRVLILVHESSTASLIAAQFGDDIEFQVAESLQAAKDFVRARRHHFVIWQYTGSATAPGEENFAQILPEIQANWKDTPHAYAVFATDDYPGFELAGEHGVIISTKDKTLGESMKVFLELIRSRDLTGINWDLEISIADDIVPDANCAGGPGKWREAVEEILRRLFAEPKPILYVVSMPRKGYSGATLLTAAFPSSGGKGRVYVIKIGEVALIEREARNIAEFVDPHAIDFVPPVVGGCAKSRVAAYAGIRFQEIDQPIQVYDKIEDAKTDAEIAECCEILSHAANELNGWYRTRHVTYNLNLVDHMLPPDIRRAAEEDFSSMTDDLSRVENEVSDLIDIHWEAGRATINRFFRTAPGAGTLTYMDFAPIHGDLHTWNILVPTKAGAGARRTLWIIDMESMRQDTPMLDFAKLESHLVMDCLGRRCEGGDAFASRLERLRSWYSLPCESTFVLSQANGDDPALHKLTRLVGAVRKLALQYGAVDPEKRNLGIKEEARRYLLAVLQTVIRSMGWMKDRRQFDRNARALCLLLGSLVYDALAGQKQTTFTPA